jgi:hypothetical protein
MTAIPAVRNNTQEFVSFFIAVKKNSFLNISGTTMLTGLKTIAILNKVAI